MRCQQSTSNLEHTAPCSQRRPLNRPSSARKNLVPTRRPCVSMMAAARRMLRGVAFDMDGTLTVPCIDFQLMRQRCGVLKGDILEAIERMQPDAAARAKAAIWDIEQQALQDMQLMPGVADLCSFLDSHNIPRGLITRNVKASVEHFHVHHLKLPAFSPALGRECGLEFEPKLRFKPHPDALLHICSSWGIDPSEAMFIGDSVKDDIVCGNRAGAWTVLLDQNRRYKEEDLQGEMKPSFVVSDMEEVIPLLQQQFELQPPPNAESIIEVSGGTALTAS